MLHKTEEKEIKIFLEINWDENKYTDSWLVGEKVTSPELFSNSIKMDLAKNLTVSFGNIFYH